LHCLLASKVALDKIHAEINLQARKMNKRPKDKPRFKDVFNRFDVDGTGVIDASELRQGLVGFG
jgi:Ca2+-binding EF-hand superfamily protein